MTGGAIPWDKPDERPAGAPRGRPNGSDEPPWFDDLGEPGPERPSVRLTAGSIGTRTALELITAADLLAEPPPAQEWLVGGLFPAAGVMLTTGPRKSLKTLLTLQLAIAVAGAGSFLGRRIERHGSVLFVEQEGSRAGFRSRLALMLRDQAPPAIWFAMHQRVRIDVPASWARVEAAVADLRPVLVVLDPLVFLHLGDENSNTEMAGVMRPLVELAAEYETCVDVLHHLNKGTERNQGRPSDRIRGAGAFAAATDGNIVMDREGKHGVRVQGEFRDAEDLDLYLELDPDALRLDLAERPEGSKVSRAELVAWVGEAGRPVGITDAQERFGVSRGAAWNALFAAAGMGLIDHYQDPRNKAHQFIPLGVS